MEKVNLAEREFISFSLSIYLMYFFFFLFFFLNNHRSEPYQLTDANRAVDFVYKHINWSITYRNADDMGIWLRELLEK